MSESVTQSGVGPSRSNYMAGRFEHALDVKRRIIVPAVWRDMMNHPKYVYILPSPKTSCRCLIMAPPAEMDVVQNMLRQRPLFDETLDDSLSYIGENSEIVMMDVQGRIRIRDRLLEFAGLSETVVWIGAGRKAELWAAERRPEREGIDQDLMATAIRRVSM